MCAFAAAAVYTTCDTVARGEHASSSTGGVSPARPSRGNVDSREHRAVDRRLRAARHIDQPRRATRRARVLRLRDRRRVDRVQHASRRRARWPCAACSARASTSASPMASSPRSASACGTTSRPTRPAGGGYGAARARAALPRQRWMEHARARHEEDGRLVSSSASEAPPSLARRPPQAARRRFGRAKGQALASI